MRRAGVGKYNENHDKRGRFSTAEDAVEARTLGAPRESIQVAENEYTPTMTDAAGNILGSQSTSQNTHDGATISPTSATGLTIVHGSPKDAVELKSGDGAKFLAPPKADFNQVFAAGRAKGSSLLSGIAAIGHFGTFDFQRDGDNFYTAYADASNYAVGVYMAGAGYSLKNTIFIGKFFARAFSSNAGVKAQEDWWTRGWNDASTNSGPFSSSP